MKYRDATNITGQLVAAAELRLAIYYDVLFRFHKREIRRPARLLYKKYRDYYDTKAAVIRHRLTFNEVVVDQLDIVMLHDVIFKDNEISDMIEDIVDHYANCFDEH